MSLEDALSKRRSVRSFAETPLTPRQILKLCWAAQGISDPRRGFRTSPSAGGLYPLELYVAIAGGVMHYQPDRHVMIMRHDRDVRRSLQDAAFGQPCVGQAPAVFVIAGVVSRTTQKYGPRAERYVLIEVGHAAQNLLLQATALGLGAVPVGAFSDHKVAKALELPEDHAVFYIIPVGTPAP